MNQLTTEDLDRFEAEFGVIPKVVSRLIRPTFIAHAGNTLVWSDFSSIEARVLPWLSGAPGEAKLDVFRENDADPSLPDIYEVEAGGIYDIDPNDVDKDRRQTGKISTLSLGFGGGVGALSAMAAGYGLALEDDLKQFIVTRWRANNKWAVDFWGALNAAFFSAWDNPNTPFFAGRITYIFRPDYLYGTMFAIMPCGRSVTYAALKREKVKIEDRFGDVTEEWKVRYTSGYERKSIWRGLLAENLCQAFAAALLRDVIVRLNRLHQAGEIGPVVLHVHDEVGIEPPEDHAAKDAQTLKTVMETNPVWAGGLPLVADLTENWFYSRNA